MSDERPIGVDDRALDGFALEALAESCATTPPAALRARVLDAIRTAPARPEPPRAATTRWRLAGALAASLALVLGGLLARERTISAERLAALQTAEATAVELTARLEAQGRTVVGLREALAAQAQVLRVVGGPRVLSASLAPTAGHDGAGRVHVDPTTGDGAVVLAGVPALPQGRVYELWAIRGDAPPEPAGLLAAVAPDLVVARTTGIARPGEVTAFAVSVEPAGGSPTPTGPVVLVGNVRG